MHIYRLEYNLFVYFKTLLHISHSLTHPVYHHICHELCPPCRERGGKAFLEEEEERRQAMEEVYEGELAWVLVGKLVYKWVLVEVVVVVEVYVEELAWVEVDKLVTYEVSVYVWVLVVVVVVVWVLQVGDAMVCGDKVVQP